MTTPSESAYVDAQIPYNKEIERQYLIKPSHFVLLSVCSLGIYMLWWTYKAYRFFAQKEGSDSNSAIKALFNFIFLIPLLYKILMFSKEKGYTGGYIPILIYILFIAFTITGLLPLPFFLIFSHLSCIFLIVPVRAFNFAIAQSSEIRSYADKGLTALQISIVVLGSLFWFLFLVGNLVMLVSSIYGTTDQLSS